MARHLVEHDEEHRDLLFRAYVYLRINLLADVLHFPLAVLRDEHDDGKDDGFKRNHHREEVERVRVEDADTWNIAEVGEYPEDEDADVCNEKGYCPELQGEKGEGVWIKYAEARNIAEVDEYPEDEDADVCNEKRYCSELQSEKFRESIRPSPLYLQTRLYLLAYPFWRARTGCSVFTALFSIPPL